MILGRNIIGFGRVERWWTRSVRPDARPKFAKMDTLMILERMRGEIDAVTTIVALLIDTRVDRSVHANATPLEAIVHILRAFRQHVLAADEACSYLMRPVWLRVQQQIVQIRACLGFGKMMQFRKIR